MRDANLRIVDDELLPIEREPNRWVVALALACYLLLAGVAGWSLYIVAHRS
jgi:hypothetical protein